MSPEIKRGPVTPVEAAELQTNQMPDEVFVAFNGLIAQNLYNGRAVVRQKEIVAKLVEQGLDKGDIYDKHWLDVEGSYRAAGWKVTYEKPVYYGGENFEPYFEFIAKKQSE